MASETAVLLDKTTIDEIKHTSMMAWQTNSERVARIESYEEIYKMLWDFEIKDGDWVQRLPSPEPHNAIKGIVRLLVGSKPSINAITDGADITYKEYVEDICKVLLKQADRRGPWIVMYDLVMSSALASECYVKCVNVEDNVRYLQQSGKEGMAKRYARLAKEKPFIYRVYNPKWVFPEWSDLGLEAVTIRMERPIREVAAFWGEDAVEGLSTPATEEHSGTHHEPMCVYWERHGYDNRQIWIDGIEEPIYAKPNTLGFLPWAGSIVEGTSLFEDPEDQRLGILYPVFQSGYWHAQSYADSIMYSLALNLGKYPQLKAKLNDPGQDVEDLVDWSLPLGVMKLAINEDVEMFDKKVIDDSLQVAANIAGSRMGDMLIPKQVLGSAPENVLAFASLNLLVQAGRLPLVPIQRMVGTVMGHMLELPFQWAKARNKTYPIRSWERPLEIDPAMYEDVFIDVELRASFAQDDAQKSAVALNNVNGGLWSVERGMEYTGVDEPLKERAKVADDIERRMKTAAASQAEANKVALAAQAASALVAAGGNLMSPQQVEYRPGEDALMLCGNCAFFQGPGIPCQIVNVAIDPFFTCNEWQPNPEIGAAPTPPAPAAAGGGIPGGIPSEIANALGGEGGLPSLVDPNQLQGGGGAIPAEGAPSITRETASGTDRGGNPLTSGQGLPLG